MIDASVHFDVEGQVGILTLDNPPSNQFTNDLVVDLAAAETRPSVPDCAPF